MTDDALRDFVITNDQCSSRSLGPEETCYVETAFPPKAGPAYRSALLKLTAPGAISSGTDVGLYGTVPSP